MNGDCGANTFAGGKNLHTMGAFDRWFEHAGFVNGTFFDTEAPGCDPDAMARQPARPILCSLLVLARACLGSEFVGRSRWLWECEPRTACGLQTPRVVYVAAGPTAGGRGPGALGRGRVRRGGPRRRGLHRHVLHEDWARWRLGRAWRWLRHVHDRQRDHRVAQAPQGDGGRHAVLRLLRASRAALAQHACAVVRRQVRGGHVAAQSGVQLLRPAPHQMHGVAAEWAPGLLPRAERRQELLLPLPQKGQGGPAPGGPAGGVVGRRRLQRAHLVPAVLRRKRRAVDRRAGPQALPVPALGGRFLRRHHVLPERVGRVGAWARVDRPLPDIRRPEPCFSTSAERILPAKTGLRA